MMSWLVMSGDIDIDRIRPSAASRTQLQGRVVWSVVGVSQDAVLNSCPLGVL